MALSSLMDMLRQVGRVTDHRFDLGSMSNLVECLNCGEAFDPRQFLRPVDIVAKLGVCRPLYKRVPGTPWFEYAK